MALDLYARQTITGVPVIYADDYEHETFIGLHQSLMSKFGIRESYMVTVYRKSTGQSIQCPVREVDNENWEADESGVVWLCTMSGAMCNLFRQGDVVDLCTLAVAGFE